ncbi:histidine kinase [Halovivax asiaticus JCM 14624]|uniref:histidine kinase n=1 Tax=Halovivax asiaticus JCM 14624 TaxID=1227490 RepID=M0BW42_9EURY|nr:HAMP domain-containing sensor histidine kinase [Halovivax asiaticus]ELZ13874.1 histidine kinase [Halovivax asiaticus JCM 14624]
MTDDGITHSSAIGQWPDPVCQVATDDGTPIVEWVNEGFELTFGSVEAGEPAASVFETLELSVVLGPDDPGEIGTTDDTLIIESGTRSTTAGSRDRYLLRVVSADENADGVFLFSPLPTGATRAAGEIGLDHVASVISHDLRNPLDVANARLRAARESGEDKHFEHVARAHDRMERIVEDVLTLARGAAVVQPDERVDLASAAAAAWGTVETHDADFAVDGSLPTVVADSNRLGRLFENLFRNAVEHGGVDVTVTVGPLAEAAGFYVADDGRGIQPGRREQVFDPGFSTDDHGTGLGLSIVGRIVDLHGWEITITESAADGARFEITGLEIGCENVA